MSYLPIIVKKSRPFLEALSSTESSQRGVCPRGKLLAFLDPSGHLRVHHLSDDSQQVLVDSDTFVGCQWVLPCRTNQDCVSELKQQQKSELLAVSSSLDFHWFSVCEVERVASPQPGEPDGRQEEKEEKADREGDSISFELVIESLAVLKKKDLGLKLRHFDCSDIVDSVRLLGSDGGQVLVLVNSSLVCSLTMDTEFDRVALHDCIALEMSFDPYEDDLLPRRAGYPVSFTFRTPLLFAMTLDGVVFIYNINSAVCIGIVSATQYCQYACGRQPDSEELLSTISASYFRLSWVSPDLTHLVVSTYDNNLLFINLPEYFQVFSNHYHPSFVRTFQNSQLNDQAASIKKSDMSQEETEDQIKYAGAVTTPTGYLDKSSTDFVGQPAWMNRIGRLKQSVSAFQPSDGRYLSFHQTSNLQLNSGIKLISSKSQLHGKSGGASESQKVEVQPSQSSDRAWYEEPISHTIATSRSNFGSWENFGLSFVTGMKKSVPEHHPAGPHSNVNDALSPLHYYYKNYCVLPAASCLLDSESTVIHVEFASSLVVAFYGQTVGEDGAKPRTVRNSQGQFVENHVTVPVTGVALYNVSSLSYSIRRFPQPSWLVLSSHPDQLLCLVNEQSLTVATFNLSQEEFVGKVLMYGNASIAEEVCQLNRWDNCSLPINALETALELRQLDTLAFFLRSRETDNSEVEQGQEETTQVKKHDQSDSDEALYLPPLPPDQLDTVVKLLIDAINKNYKEEHYCQFASHLLIMTLGFLTRMIKSQTLLEEHTAEILAGPDIPREGGGESQTSVSPVKRTISGTSSDTMMQSSSLPEISVSSLDLASYVHQLRSYLPKASALIGGKPPDGGSAERARVGLDRETTSRSESYTTEFMDRSITSRWDKQKPKEVIRDALLRGCLPLAQSYLIQRGPQDVGRGFGRSISLVEAIDDYSGSSHYDASLNNMMTTATGFVMEALEKKSIKQATSILTQMGLNVRSSLRHICFHTLSRELRDFLANELSSRGWLSDEELQTLEYLHILERFYPHESYDEAHNLQPNQPRKNQFQSTSLPVMPGMVSRPTPIPSMGNLQELYPETFGGDHALSWDSATPSSTPVTSFSSHGESSSLYLQVPLAVVMQWDLATRQRLLFEGFLLNGQADGLDCEKLVNKEYIFNYYVRHNNITGAVQFVTSRVPPLENPTPCPAQILSLNSNMPHSTCYLSNTLLDELARHGVLLPHELNNLPNLLNRLGRVHSLFSQPHPLTKISSHQLESQKEEPTTPDDSKQQGKDDGAIISVEAFHRSFLKYLMENRFCSLMYHYLDCYGLALDEVSISTLGLDSPNQQPWVQVMLRYRMAAQNPNNPTAMFLASLSCGNLLLSNGNGGSGERMSVMRMLRDNRTLMAIATLMHAPVPLEEAMNTKNSGQPWYVDPTTFRRAIAAYPSLQAAIFPPPPTTVTPAQSQDISLYQLLHGTVSFNISRLFQWQSNNTLATHHDDSVENFREVPHFSSPALMEKYALTEHLNYVYYLRRGQPSFAYANFVAAKLLGHSKTTKRIDHVVSHVYRLALLDFTNSKLSSSCAAFVEMLDRDSTLLRVDTQAALRIARYSGEEDGRDHSILSKEDGDKHRELATQFIHLFQNPDNVNISSSLLSKLEQATFNMVKRAGVETCGLEAEECWNLVQRFAHYHHQSPSLEFVKLCAKHGEWLPLLCHAEIFRIPPNKIMGIVEQYFSNPCVKEHLQQAISAMERDHLQTPTSPLADGAEKYRSKRKRLGSSSSRSAAKMQKTEATVAARTDLRAKFYSKVGLKRDVTPQTTETPPTGHDELAKGAEGEEPVTTRTTASGDIEAASPPQEREVVFLPPPLEEESLPSDLFSVLFKCEAHDTPWRSLLAHAVALQRPLLAILAACYEDASVVDCMCVWLYASLGTQVMEKAITVLGIPGDLTEDKIRFSAELQWMSWSPFKLGLLLISAMQHSPCPAAAFTQAFSYFDLNNPLLGFLRFYEEFVLRSNYEECRNYLQEFKLNIDKASNIGYTGTIGDLLWVQQVASIMASHMLMVCPTPFERSHLLRLLAEAEFGSGRQFKCHVLDFHNLHQMSLVLSEAGLASDAAFTVKEHFSTTPGLTSLPEVYSVRVRVNTDHVLGLLLEKEQFNIARKYAELVNSTKSQISIKEAEHNLRKISKSSYWRYEQARLNFWYQCDSNFQNAEVDAELASEFFESVVHSLSEDVPLEEGTSDTTETELAPPSPPACSAKDRALLLALALKWRKESKLSSLSPEQLRDFEREIWVEHIRAAMEASNNIGKGYSSPLPFLPEVEHCSSILPIYNQSSLLSSLSISGLEEYKGRRQLSELLLPDSGPVALEKKGKGSSLTDKECEAFDQILGRLLNAGLLSQARELADIFHHNSADLTIVLCCIQLAMGKLKPDQLTESVLSLVSARPPQQLTDPSLLAMPDDSQQNRPSAEIIKMMVSLSDRATYAQQCCTTIIVCFRLAVALKVPYASIIVNDPFETLTKLLSSKLSEKYQLASKFVNVCNLEASEVAGYISNEVAEALQSLRSPVDLRDSSESQVYNPKMTSTEFAELAKLCQDQNTLGYNLLSMAKGLADQLSTHDMTIQVEFLIRAHDCYTLGCSVGGIADLLVMAQSTTNKLVAGKHFKLMVRLLIGIGRFKEMSYIIGLLMQHDEFESLLSYKGNEKKEQLRIAIMDYLNHHSKEKEKLERLQLVALKFKMFRELAKLKEQQAIKELKKIKAKSLAPNNPETVKNLKNCFEGLKAAAKFYSQEDCLANAEHCYSMARLVALQLSVLQQNKQVINLEARGVLTQMEELPFTEALIVSDAYKQTMWIDWITPLYRKVIIRGDFQYLGQYKSAFPLQPSIFQELASKYIHDRERPPEAASNMKKMLAHLKNLPLKKTIAQQLGMNDLLQSLSNTYDEGFLNDIARL